MIPHEECISKLRFLSTLGIVDSICAGDARGGRDACQGDSGSPLACKLSGGNTFVLAGIVSWGVGCGMPGIPGIYTCVSHHVEFIQQAMRETEFTERMLFAIHIYFLSIINSTL